MWYIVFKISLDMLTCYVCQHVCQGNRTLFRFPSNERTKFKWMSVLGLTEFPASSARICCLHFSPCDFFYDGAKMSLMEGARPLPLVIYIYKLPKKISTKFLFYIVNRAYSFAIVCHCLTHAIQKTKCEFWCPNILTDKY